MTLTTDKSGIFFINILEGLFSLILFATLSFIYNVWLFGSLNACSTCSFSNSFTHAGSSSPAPVLPEEARRFRISGEILPLSEVLQKAEQAGIDTLLEAELEQENQHWVYEVEGVSDTNQLIELTIDAQTGRIIKREHQKRRNREAD